MKPFEPRLSFMTDTNILTIGQTNYSTGERACVLVNPHDRDWTSQRFVLWFGQCGPTYLMVWGNSLEACLHEAIDWLADHAPGLLADEQVREEYDRQIAYGMCESRAMEFAEVDTTCGGNAGNYVMSDDWGIALDNPDRATLKAWLAG